MSIEEELREKGFNWQNVHNCFCWYSLSKDFIRQFVEHDPVYKTQLEHELLMDFHGFSIHASFFYQNMFKYLKAGLAEAKDLACYADRIYLMYRERKEAEWNASREVYKFVDGATGKVLDQWVM